MSPQSPIAAALEQFELERTNLLARVEKLDDLIARTREVFHLPAKAHPTTASGTNGHDAVSIEALRAALQRGPLAPGAIAKQLGVGKVALRHALQQFEANGLVVGSGNRTTRRIALPRAAKEVP